jgi:hypothetical protein
VFKYIGNSNNFVVIADLGTIPNGTLGTTTSTDKSDFDFIASGNVSGLCKSESACHCGTGGKDGCGFQEITA